MSGHEMRTQEVADKLRQAARFSYSPRFVLFHATARGEYTLLLQSGSADDMARRFMSEAIKPETIGLDLRCDGSRVDV